MNDNNVLNFGVMSDFFSEGSTFTNTGDNSVVHMCVDQPQTEKDYSTATKTCIDATASAHANQYYEQDTDCQNNSADYPSTKFRRGRRTNVERLNSHRSSSTCSTKDYFKRKRDLDESLENPSRIRQIKYSPIQKRNNLGRNIPVHLLTAVCLKIQLHPLHL